MGLKFSRTLKITHNFRIDSMKNIALILLVLTLGLAACGNETPNTPGELTASPVSETPSPAEALASEVTPVATGVKVVMVTITSTPKPTTAPTRTATPKATPKPTATPTPAYEAVITGDLVNLRSGPDTGYMLVGEAVLSQTLQITGQNKDSSWWQVCCAAEDGGESWVLADLVETNIPAKNLARQLPIIEFPPEMTGVVVGGLINLRQGPGTQFEMVGEIPLGNTVSIVARNEDNTWWEVCCPTGKGQTSWIAPEFLVTNVSPDDALRRLLAANPTATPSPTPNAKPTAQAAAVSIGGIITGDLVNLRDGPGTRFNIVGAAVLSDTVQIIGKNKAGTWWQICCRENTTTPAWVINEFVEIDKAIDTSKLPVVTPEAAVASQTEISLPGAPNLPAVGSYAAPKSANPLTGLPLSADKRSLRPTVVCINNDPQARPQYGIGQADVMYEYLMEGYSITRYSGVFYGDSPTRIGPIRSARLINYYMAALYNAPLFCSGASDQVRFMLKNQAPFPYLDIDLDDPSNRRYSDSIGTDYRTRLNTSADYLARWKSDWEIEEAASIRGFTFGDLPDGGETATAIEIPYTKATGSQVRYEYTANGGRYLRYLDDDPHVDSDTGRQVAVENVLVQSVTHQVTDMVEDSLGNKGILLDLFEGGKAILFRDGKAFAGTWRSSLRGDMPHFFDQNGAEIPLKAGKTWISVVPNGFDVTYQ